jgi:hypothetical protein
MSQKKINLEQVESGVTGKKDLSVRLGDTDTAINNINQSITDLDSAKSADIARVNETVMAMASAPVTTPVFSEIQSYKVLAADITAGQPVTVTVPNGKTYKVGKSNLTVLLNGVVQVLVDGDYTEASSTTIQFSADILKENDVVTFVIGTPSKLNYSTAVAYYTTGGDIGKIQTVTYTGDIERTITYTYNAEGKIATEAVVEDGKTTTKTYTYDGTTGKITTIASVVA